MPVWSLTIVARRPRPATGTDRIVVMIFAAFGLTDGVVVMGVTRWPAVSAAGVAFAAFASAYVVRALTAVLNVAGGSSVERVLIRGNAYASVASIAAPLAIAASIALDAGWLPGLAIPVGVGAVVIAVTSRGEKSAAPRACLARKQRIGTGVSCLVAGVRRTHTGDRDRVPLRKDVR